MNLKELTNYIFEIETLKNIKRSGSFLARIKDPDSVAEHVAVAAQVAFILAKLEGADASRCALIILFHDNAEVRIGDLNKLNARYIQSKESEKTAFHDQLKNLPNAISVEIQSYFLEYAEQKSLEAKICRDADLLELAFQSKIYLELGFKAKKDWLSNISGALYSKSAKEIFSTMIETDSYDWWQGLKKL